MAGVCLLPIPIITAILVREYDRVGRRPSASWAAGESRMAITFTWMISCVALVVLAAFLAACAMLLSDNPEVSRLGRLLVGLFGAAAGLLVLWRVLTTHVVRRPSAPPPPPFKPVPHQVRDVPPERLPYRHAT